MSEVTIGIVACFIMLLLFLTGLELAFGMAIVGFVGFAYLVSFSAASNLLVKDFFDTFTSYGFTVIPMFVLMGQIAQHTDIARRLYLATHKFVGHIPGGLAMATVGGATTVQGRVRIDLGHRRCLCGDCHSGDGPLRVRQKAVYRCSGFGGHIGRADPTKYCLDHLCHYS